MDALDVVVVGGGLAGWTATTEILRARPDARVTLLEASDRLGGRTYTTSCGDLGGQWIGTQQWRMTRLCQTLDLQLEEQHDAGRRVLLTSDGTRKTYTGLIPPFSLRTLYELEIKLLRKLDALAHRVVPDSAFVSDTELTRRYDALSVAAWGTKRLRTVHARRILNLTVNAVVGCEASTLSMLHFLYLVRSAGSVKSLLETKEGCAQSLRIIGGTQQISEQLAQEAEKIGKNFCLKLSHVVDEIRVVAPGPLVKIRCSNAREEFVARAVVVATAPGIFLDRVSFRPPLPRRISRCASRTFRGCYSKICVTFEEAWWRSAGYAGEIVAYASASPADEDALDTAGILTMAFDYVRYVTLPTAETEGVLQYSLICFVTGAVAAAVEDWSPERRRAGVETSLRRAFDVSRLPPIVDYQEKIWATDPYARGCPNTLYPPGTFLDHAPQRHFHRPLAFVNSSEGASESNLVFWASTDIATEWNGYMEGAVQAGGVAAAGALEALYASASVLALPIEKIDADAAHWKVADDDEF